MQHRLILPLLCCIAGFTSTARAQQPITLTQANAVAPPRLDPGSGICGSVIHFVPQMAPLDMISQAVALLDLPATDPNIAARVTTTFTNINFRNANPSSTGDFGPPNFTKSLFPFSDDPSAMPPGDDINFAMRIRGQLFAEHTAVGALDFFAPVLAQQ